MATDVAIAIRKSEAQERIARAARKLGKALDCDVPDLAPTHKDLAIQVPVQLEAIADFLEVVARKVTKDQDGEADAEGEISPEAALAEAEATDLADEGALAEAEATRLAEEQAPTEGDKPKASAKKGGK